VRLLVNSYSFFGRTLLGVPHKNVEWTEVLKVLTPLLSREAGDLLERERSLQGYCAQQICGMTSLVHSKREVKNKVRQSDLLPTIKRGSNNDAGTIIRRYLL
jgi:hypothetical protein